ncbi:beta propeller repeat protein [Paludisphaera rhizosphaerae]|uniref:hypothetical protein n=1 Tax=Paludisphaera rhizosphaerae TaxID=2711216 RepID=UPI0013EA8A0E|nr:hypothetical protein [Paludisphaera rhizosphaerae]
MRRVARAIGNLLILAAGLLGAGCVAEGPTSAQADTPLTAVSKRQAYVYASTPDGLFRASVAAKRWERLKTPPEMPLNGTFARQPALSPLIIYVALRSRFGPEPRPGLRYGLYLSKDDGVSWELVSDRDDFGDVLHHPSGALFAVTGSDGVNAGSHLLRSPDMGKTWRDITGTAFGQFMAIQPDHVHPNLVRIYAWAIRDYRFEAADENYRWRCMQANEPEAGKLTDEEFFSRDSSSSNRYWLYPATLANYFGYDFGNQTEVQALEVVPLKSRFEFARGARVTIPIRVVFHQDGGAPGEKFADQPGGLDFWGVRVRSSGAQVVKSPLDRRVITITVDSTEDGKLVSTRSEPPPVKYQVFDLTPTTPYERPIDLDRLADFSKSGEYRVQIVYSFSEHGEGSDVPWNGHFTSPVFTVAIQE